jgi:hypothetical protein
MQQVRVISMAPTSHSIIFTQEICNELPLLEIQSVDAHGCEISVDLVISLMLYVASHGTADQLPHFIWHNGLIPAKIALWPKNQRTRRFQSRQVHALPEWFLFRWGLLVVAF